MKLLLFDTETTGLPKTREAAIRGSDNWPHLVSIAWIVVENDKILKSEYHIIKPQWDIPADSTKIHGITTEKANAEGKPLSDVILKFLEEPHDVLIAHNMDFDFNVIVNAIIWDLRLAVPPDTKPRFCTMEASRGMCRIPFANGRGFKSPKLIELYELIMKKKPVTSQLHNSLYDVQLLAEIVINSTVIRSMIGLSKSPIVNNNAYSEGSTLII